MKTTLKTLALFFGLSVIFMGCPYSAEIPIDTASVKIDDKLLGSWEAKSSSDYSYTVTKADDKTYTIEKKSASSGDVTTYKGYLSDVAGTKYLNIYEDGSTTITYYFYKYEITSSGSKATLTPVTENIDEKFTTSTELKDFFKKNQGLSFFFDKDEDVYIKN